MATPHYRKKYDMPNDKMPGKGEANKFNIGDWVYFCGAFALDGHGRIKDFARNGYFVEHKPRFMPQPIVEHYRERQVFEPRFPDPAGRGE